LKNIIYIALLFLFSCSNDIELGKDYFITTNSQGDIAIGKDKVNGLFTWESHSYLVYGHIVDYVVDSHFVLIAEKPRDSVPGSLGLKLNYKESQEVFKNSSFRQYYILHKGQDSLYGPFNVEKYKEMKDLLSVNEKLKLN